MGSEVNNTGRRQRTFQWQDPMAAFAKGAKLPGIDYLKAMLAEEIPPPPVAEMLDIGLHSIAPGHVVFQAQAAEYYYNPGGAVHGGVITTLLDSAMGCAVLTHLDAGVGYGTVQLNIHMVRPVTVEVGTIRAEGSTLHVGRSIATCDARLVDLEGKLYAHGTSTCAIFPLPV